nr:MAG TPA: Terminase small subunit [Caudoviricetes sp.]
MSIYKRGGDDVTDKQRKWIDYYKQGETATNAARLAGYKCKDDNSYSSVGAENLQKLADYIKDRDAIVDSDRVADMQEINAFWTATMRDKDADTKDRLKASELRARAAGAFIERREVVQDKPFEVSIKVVD